LSFLSSDFFEQGLDIIDERQEASLVEIEEYHFAANQTFRSEDEAYDFYNDYVKVKGFSIRKRKVRKSIGTNQVIWRRFLCSCEGYRDVKYFERKALDREPNALIRCGCCAFLEIPWSEKNWNLVCYEFCGCP
jgi:hypothetical protein